MQPQQSLVTYARLGEVKGRLKSHLELVWGVSSRPEKDPRAEQRALQSSLALP